MNPAPSRATVDPVTALPLSGPADAGAAMAAPVLARLPLTLLAPPARLPRAVTSPATPRA